ncbi:MAG: hypothetical protein HOM77_08025 [Planctomycetes bacterium]|nr:hypothetical protein [Planctomycetota bacterium]
MKKTLLLPFVLLAVSLPACGGDHSPARPLFMRLLLASFLCQTTFCLQVPPTVH